MGNILQRRQDKIWEEPAEIQQALKKLKLVHEEPKHYNYPSCLRYDLHIINQ